MDKFADIPIIDAHVHMTMPYSMAESLQNFRAMMAQRGYERLVFMAYSESSDNHGDPLNGLKALWYKLQIRIPTPAAAWCTATAPTTPPKGTRIRPAACGTWASTA